MIKSNSIDVTDRLLVLLRIPIGEKEILEKFDHHPNNGTLLCISDVLKDIGIRNKCVRINPQKLPLLKKPFLAEISYDKELNYFTVVKSISNGFCIFYNPRDKKWEKITIDNFIQIWTTVVLIPASPGKQLTKGFYLQRMSILLSYGLKIAILLLIASVLFLKISQIISNGESVFPSIILIISYVLGAFITLTLINSESLGDNPILNKICYMNASFNCNNVLTSKASHIFGISWSVLGFTYFLGGLVVLLIFGITNRYSNQILVGLSFLAIPFIIFSIFYQGWVIRQWCILCLLTQLVLVSQIIINFLTIKPFVGPVIRLDELYSMAFVYVFIFLTSKLHSNYNNTLQENKKNKKIIADLKFNQELFDKLLVQQRCVEVPDQLGVQLGNKYAKYTVLKICNPYCDPCVMAHSMLESIVESNQNVKLQILYNVTNEENNILTLPVSHFLAIAEENNEHLLRTALHDWYTSKTRNYKNFAKKYPIGDLSMQAEKLRKMHDWCKSMKVEDRTPIYFINGYELPDIYSVNDLILLLN
jgi:uncharacterized membrane protein